MLSAVVITKNEETNIGRCLESIRWVDEIILVDSSSGDRTVEIAQQYGASIVQCPWHGYGPAKREGVSRAAGPWILSVDADEEVSSELKESIRRALVNNGSQVGFRFMRQTNFLGRWIRHSGWYPEKVLRLFHKEHGNFRNAVVHEYVELSGEIGFLSGQLRHYSYPDLETYFEKFNRYTTLGAQEAMKKGKRAGWFRIALAPPANFIRQYLLRLGLLDGIEGFLIAALSSAALMVKYAKLRHLIRQGKHNA